MKNVARLRELGVFYRRALLDDYVPFWLKHARDRACGGYQVCLDRDGSVYEHDKVCMWSAGRMIWIFSHLYNELAREPAWLEMARWGVDFTLRHGFAEDGLSMWYALTREGAPLEPPTDFATEMSAVIGFSEYARATADEKLHERARAVFFHTWRKLCAPEMAFPVYLPATRPVRRHAHSMITLNVVQELRRFRPDPVWDGIIDQCLAQMLEKHARPAQRAVLEAVAWDGGNLPGWLGRWVCPGHMLEGGIFLVREGRYRNDQALVRAGLDWIDWGFERGWDPEFGGIFNDVDLAGAPVPTGEQLLYQTKLWWQHAEALHALLLAHAVSGETRYLDAYEKVHAYSFSKFADPEYGEWFAMLDRRGNRFSDVKGNARKSLFHLGRNCLWNILLLERESPA